MASPLTWTCRLPCPPRPNRRQQPLLHTQRKRPAKPAIWPRTPRSCRVVESCGAFLKWIERLREDWFFIPPVFAGVPRSRVVLVLEEVRLGLVRPLPPRPALRARARSGALFLSPCSGALKETHSSLPRAARPHILAPNARPQRRPLPAVRDRLPLLVVPRLLRPFLLSYFQGCVPVAKAPLAIPRRRITPSPHG